MLEHIVLVYLFLLLSIISLYEYSTIFISFVGGIFDVVHGFILSNDAKTNIHILANTYIWTWTILFCVGTKI